VGATVVATTVGVAVVVTVGATVVATAVGVVVAVVVWFAVVSFVCDSAGLARITRINKFTNKSLNVFIDKTSILKL
jgi:hypothetical protein